MLPSVGSMRSAIRRMSVVLPQPDGPMRRTNCPSSMVRLASCKATASALPTTKRLPTPVTSMIGEAPLIQWPADLPRRPGGGTGGRIRGRTGGGAAQQLAPAGVAHELAVLRRYLATNGDHAGAAVYLHALETGVIGVHGVRLGADGAAVAGVVNHDVGVGSHGDDPLLRVETEYLRRSGGRRADEALEAETAAANAVGVEQVHAVLDGGDTVGDLREVAAAHLLLALEVEGGVVGGHRVDHAGVQRVPQRLLVALVTQRRRHHVLGALEVGPLRVGLVEDEVRHHDLDAEVHAAELGGQRRLQRRLAAEVHHVALGAGELHERGEVVGAVRLHPLGATGLVPLRADLAFRQQARLQLRHDLVVLAVGSHHHAQLPRQPERLEQLLVVHAEEALVGEEDLERRHAVLHQLAQGGFRLIVELGDAYVEGVIAGAVAGRQLVPVPVARLQVLQARGRQHLYIGGGAAHQRRLAAGGVRVLGDRAHERQVDVHVRVDEAREDVLAAGVYHFGAVRCLQVLADGGDRLVLDVDVGHHAAAGVDDLAVLYEQAHCRPFRVAVGLLQPVAWLAGARRPARAGACRGS